MATTELIDFPWKREEQWMLIEENVRRGIRTSGADESETETVVEAYRKAFDIVYYEGEFDDLESWAQFMAIHMSEVINQLALRELEIGRLKARLKELGQDY